MRDSLLLRVESAKADDAVLPRWLRRVRDPVSGLGEACLARPPRRPPRPRFPVAFGLSPATSRGESALSLMGLTSSGRIGDPGSVVA
jgi:hypothetical protein